MGGSWCSISHPAPCLRPGKADKDSSGPWAPAILWVMQKKLGAQLWLLQLSGE